MPGRTSSFSSDVTPIKISAEWVLAQGLYAQDFYNRIDSAFPEIDIDFGTPVVQIINQIIVLYHAYIERQPQGTHILAIDHPTERQVMQVYCLRQLIRQEQRAAIQAAVGRGNLDLLDIVDMNAHWRRLDGSLRLLFPRTNVFGVVTSPHTYPPTNPGTAVEPPQVASGQWPTDTVIPPDGTYLTIDDTPPVSSTDDEESVSEGEGNSVGDQQRPGGLDSRAEARSSEEGSHAKEGGPGDATVDTSGDRDPGVYGDDEASAGGASSGGESDDPRRGGNYVISNQVDFPDRSPEATALSLPGVVRTTQGDCPQHSDFESLPGLTHRTSADDSWDDNNEQKTCGHRGGERSSAGDHSDSDSSTNDSSHGHLHSENESQVHTTEDVAIVEGNNPDSESAPDDEDFAGALPPDEIVPLQRHIGDTYDSDDEDTEHHLFGDIYGHGPVARSATSVPWAWWWAMCPKLLIQLCNFEQLLRNELLCLRAPDGPGVALRKECRMRTDKALGLLMWLGAVLLFVSKTMPDDHVDEDHQRKKLRMGKLTRQVIRGIWEASAVVGSVRQTGHRTGSEVREDLERQLKRIHGRCARRREMLRAVTLGEVDLPQVGELEIFHDEEGEEEAEDAAEVVPVVADLTESNVNIGGILGTIVPSKWWKRGRRCSEGSYSLAE